MIIWIFIIISIPSIFIVGAKILSMQKCPDDHELKSVVLGRANKNSELADSVIKHLGICKDCRQRVRELNET